MNNIDLTKVDELKRLKESFNNVIENKIEEATVKTLAESIDKAPFLTCRKIMENMLPELYENKEGKKLICKYIKLLKENKAMFASYVTYDNIMKPDNVDDANVFVNTCLSLRENIDKTLINNGMPQLRGIVKEALLLINPNSDTLKNLLDSDKTLCEALDNVFMKKQTLHNSVEYANSINTILENVKTKCNRRKDTIDNSYTRNSIKENIDKINEIINENELEQWQRELISKTITHSMAGSNENLFNEYKTKCINMLNESSINSDESETNKSKMKLMLEQLTEKNYNEETFLNDMLKLGSLITCLQDNIIS